MKEIKWFRNKRIFVPVVVTAILLAAAGIYMLHTMANHSQSSEKMEDKPAVSEKLIEEIEDSTDVEKADSQSDIKTEETDHTQDNIVSEETQSASVNVMYHQYYDKLVEIQDQYGVCEEASEDTDDPFLEENCYLKGLCFAKLIDFDADGTEEMILAYHTGQDSESSFFQNYLVEIWAYQDSAIRKVYSAEPAKEGEGALGIHLSLLDGKYYLYSYIEEFDEETYESNYIDEWRGFDGEAIDVLKRNVCEIVYSEDGEMETYSIDDIDVTKEEWLEDREKWTDLAGDYGFQNGGSTLVTSVSELATTFKTLSEYLGIEWADNISREKEDKLYSDSVWGEELIGYWETLRPESFVGWTTFYFLEDGLVEMNTISGVCFGAFEIQSDGSVVLSLKDEYLYDNSAARWIHAESNVKIQLTVGSNMYEMNCTYVEGTEEGSFLDSVVLNRVEEEGTDYSSAEEAVQYYESECAQ